VSSGVVLFKKSVVSKGTLLISVVYKHYKTCNYIITEQMGRCKEREGMLGELETQHREIFESQAPLARARRRQR
jgi:hypothetical protein